MIDYFAEILKHSACGYLLLVEGSGEGIYIALKVGIGCADSLSKLLGGLVLSGQRLQLLQIVNLNCTASGVVAPP